MHVQSLVHGDSGGFTINDTSYTSVDDPAVKTAISNIISAHLGCSVKGSGRSATEQAQYQFVATLITLAFAIIGGALTGCVMKMCAAPCGQPEEADQYNDAPYWELEEESGEDSGEDVNADGGESIGVGYTYGKGSSMQMRNITGIAV